VRRRRPARVPLLPQLRPAPRRGRHGGELSRRKAAAYLAAETCPRCGAGRVDDQVYCVECGLRLPKARGGLAAWRRFWLRRIGWYPGDWVWTAFLAALVAAGGAAAAASVGRTHAENAPRTYVAPAPKLVAVPAATGRNGRTVWPPGLDAWTVVLGSTPSTRGKTGPLALAKHAAKTGLQQVGVLDSSLFASLHPGYYVVFTGVYGATDDADAALSTVRARGFGGAYVARVAP
jgi:hypothetical protein